MFRMARMPRITPPARERLDQRFQQLRPLLDEPRPHRGWIRAIRDALGMSGAELAARMGVTQPTIAELERNESRGTIRLDSLERAADALECDLVYFLVPRASLSDTVHLQARRQAALHLGRVGHHNALENQIIGPEAAEAHLARFAGQLVDRRGLWSSADR